MDKNNKSNLEQKLKVLKDKTSKLSLNDEQLKYHHNAHHNGQLKYSRTRLSMLFLLVFCH